MNWRRALDCPSTRSTRAAGRRAKARSSPPEMLIINCCLHGRCDVSLAGGRYTIVKEGQICASTILPTKDFYYPGQLYEGVQLYLDRRILHENEAELYFTRSQIAIVKEAEALILQDLSRRFTAKELADRFGISESSLKLYMKGILGDSYLNYFRRKRMERAAELLESTNQKVLEIANAVGYENQGKFAKAFAECYGIPPLEFRRLSR